MGKFHFEPPSSFTSLDHLVGAAGQGQRDGDAERLGGFEVQEQFHFRDLLDRQLGFSPEYGRPRRQPDGKCR
jgi:hypothetical protein